MLFLKAQETYANDLLKQKGYLFLNDVYKLLGLSETKSGQIVGWVYDEKNPVGDNFVDFGIYKDYGADFINGFGTSILLDFNVDGNILEIL